MNVRCQSRLRWQQVLLALLLCSVAACVGEYSDGLEQKFVARHQQFDELRILTTQIAKTTSITGYSVATTQFLLEGDKFASIPESLELFASSRDQLIRIKALVHELGLIEFSVTKDNSIYIMASTGGALGSSSGYIYDESKRLLKRTQKHKQIAGEQYWYVFLSS